MFQKSLTGHQTTGHRWWVCVQEPGGLAPPGQQNTLLEDHGGRPRAVRGLAQLQSRQQQGS